MTTFGGATIPPLLGGAPHPFAFIGAATTRQDPTGAAVNLNKPVFPIGALLFVAFTAPSASSTGWTTLNTSGVASYHRIADGTGNDDFLLRVDPANGTLAVFGAWNAPAGGVTILQTPGTAQLFGATDFVEPAFLVNAGFTDTLRISGAIKSGTAPTTTPIFSNAGGLGWKLAAQIYQDWNTRPLGGNTFDYTAITYAEETNAGAIAQTNLVYTPFEGGAGFVTNGRGRRWRAT